MATLGIWWSNGFWFIGPDSSKGQTVGDAYYIADDYCPHQLNKKHWAFWTGQGWIEDFSLHLTCKYTQTSI